MSRKAWHPSARGCRVMTFFKSDSPKKHLPQNAVLFSMVSSVGDVFFSDFRSAFGRKNPLVADF